MADISKIKPLGSNTTYNIKDNSAIASITRSGTTFTATRRDGTTFTFNQQDNNTWNSLSTSQAGYVAKAPNDTNKFLRGDATWAKVTWDNIDGKPTNFSPSTHTHGNITSDGTLQENGITIGDGDKILITDNSNSQKIVKASISFDGATTTKALTQKGTWETFLPLSGGTITGNINIVGNAAFNNTTTIDDAIINSLFVNGNSNFINNVNFIQIPTAPTAVAGTSTTQIATTEFVTNAVAQGFVANDAMVFKGLIGSNQPITQLPTSGYNAGWTYRVANAGIFAGEYCEVGDLLIAIKDGPTSGSSVINTDWGKVEHNIDGAVFRGSGASNSSVGSSTQPVYVNSSGIVTAITSLEVEAGGTGENSRRKAGLFYNWTTSLKGQTWSRICEIPCTSGVIGSTMILNIRHTRANVVYNETVMITVHHSSRGNITSLSSSNYHQDSIVQIRAVANSSGDCYIELKDSNQGITEGTAISPVYCTLQIISLGNDEPDLKTSFEDGTTLPENYSVAAEVTLGRNRIVTSGIFSGNLEGNAATATALSSSGTTNQFWRGDNRWSDTLGFIKINNEIKIKGYGDNNNYWHSIKDLSTVPLTNDCQHYLPNTSGWIVTSPTNGIGNNTTPIYIGEDGITRAINYTIATSVPSGAVFTDTLVKQTEKADNIEYKILTTSSASPTSGNAAEAAYDTGVTINPSIHRLSAAQIQAPTGLYSYTTSIVNLSGYIKFATLTVTAGYFNRGIQISYASRNNTGGIIYCIFSNINNKDPDLTITKTGPAKIYYKKSDTSTWDLYISKTESYDQEIFSIINPGQLGVISNPSDAITWKSEHVAELPEGYLTAAVHTIKLNIIGNATIASKLSNTSKIGDTNKPVYFTADGTPAAINYTIDKSVPSNAVFTDRYVNSATFADDSTNTAASPVKMTLTRAGSDTATVTANIPKVSISSAGVAPKGAAVSSQNQSTKFLREDGTWAAPSYTVNTNTDTLVKQTAKSDNKNYKILFTTSDSPTSGNANEAAYDTGITINPSTHTLTATKFIGSLQGNADTATTLATGRTLKVNLASTSVSTAFDGSANINDIGVSGILPIAQGGTGQNNTNNFVKAYTRSQMGNSINYDNPGVQGLFEARPASEITVTGKLPGGKQGHYPILSLKIENVMMQIAGGYFGWWIRGRQKANVTLENIDWEQLVTNSGTWDINITGAASKLSNTSAIGSSIQPVYFNSSGQPVAVNTYDKQTGKTTSFVPYVARDGVMEVGKYIDFHNTSEDTSDYIVRITARDSSETDGAGLTLTGTTVGTFKGNLNGTATKATQDGNGNNIINTYLTKTAGVTNITWDNTNKKLIKTINNSNSDIVTLYAANLKLNNTAVYNTELEIKNIKIGNGSISTSTKNVKLEYNETLETLNFVFS